ncbi:MAG: sn-glycerol-3-phosphate ABC transporter ATP-binding protein UgpC [Betaproteobacteria bacterium]|nr:MAG: sn-glycerol-3-phosphate ABC transporter ATP-binding protein UgpC [Betaproteobacteria bacterium]
MASLGIHNIRKTYGDKAKGVEVLKGINLDIADGEFLILVGGSGCGKSTLLNMIAGLETVTEGEISINGKRVNELSPKDRDIAMVFQSYALYPSMSVRENIAFGLSLRKIAKAEQEATIARVAKLLQIEALLDRKPAQLSGGQRQRVAMGRALAREPQIFLFDEPLSNLDAKLRVEMRSEIKLLHKRLGITTVYVTHDQIEAMTLGDKIAVMKDGVVQQFGTPSQIYNRPLNTFVAGFMGSPPMNLIPATVVGTGANIALSFTVGAAAVSSFTLALTLDAASEGKLKLGQAVLLGLRPEHITDASRVEMHGAQQLSVPIEITEATGADTLLTTLLGGVKCLARLHPEALDSVTGQDVSVCIDASRAVLFDPMTGLSY